MDVFHTTIARDDFFIDSMVKHITCFYRKHIMKEFCVCKSKHSDDESWIGCDAVSCKTDNKHGSKRKLVLPKLQKGQEKEEVDISTR